MGDSPIDPITRWVYLVQHGEAQPKSQDPDRPLTPAGRQASWHGAQHFMSRWNHAPIPERRLRAVGRSRTLASGESCMAMPTRIRMRAVVQSHSSRRDSR